MRRVPGRAAACIVSNWRPEACASRCRTVEPGGPAGSSRSTMPSSAATSTATAVASFVTNAHAENRLLRAGHCDGHVGPRPRFDLPQRVHRVDPIGVDRQLVSSGAAFEDRVGYSRAVRVGDQVWVSGTAPIMPGDADPPTDAYE